MTHRQDTRIKVVFLAVLVFSLLLACSFPGADGQSNQPSSNRQDDNEENLPQATETSPPTKTPVKTQFPTKTPLPLPTKTDLPTETPLPVPTAIVEGVYYFNNLNDFEDTDPIIRGEGITTQVLDGELIAEVTVPLQSYLVTLSDQEFSNAMITAWAQFEGQDAASMGLFCQYKKEEDDTAFHYVFLISRDGNYLLEYRSIAPNDDITRVELLAEGHTDVLFEPGPDVWNSIQAACMDQRLMFFVNGEVLIDVTTTRPAQAGLFGLAHYNPEDTDNLYVVWDQLTIAEP